MGKDKTEAALIELLNRVKNHKMTPEEQEAQRRSFAFGNANISNPDVTRELVDKAAINLELEQSKALAQQLDNRCIVNMRAIEKLELYGGDGPPMEGAFLVNTEDAASLGVELRDLFKLAEREAAEDAYRAHLLQMARAGFMTPADMLTDGDGNLITDIRCCSIEAAEGMPDGTYRPARPHRASQEFALYGERRRIARDLPLVPRIRKVLKWHFAPDNILGWSATLRFLWGR